jgi:hypothetical protein
MKVNSVADETLLRPAMVDMVTNTAPLPGVVSAVQRVDDEHRATTVRVPKWSFERPTRMARCLPVTVTRVPPFADPELGVMLVMTGRAGTFSGVVAPADTEAVAERSPTATNRIVEFLRTVVLVSQQRVTTEEA